jgi:hypothetical protein
MCCRGRSAAGHELREFFQLKWRGELVAEVDHFTELGRWVPVHLLVREG